MRVLLASDAPEAAEAIEYYVFRLRREIGAMAAVLGGIDGLVFTGGIGENAAPIRAKTLSGMEFLGLELDQTANHGNGPDIGVGPVRVLVIPTNEEQVIARATLVAVGLATTV
jgi:acetate kinase